MDYEKIKEIFYSIEDGKEYQDGFKAIRKQEGESSPSDDNREYYEKIKAADKKLANEIDNEIFSTAALYELCGFVLGFKYAMELAAECGIKAVA